MMIAKRLLFCMFALGTVSICAQTRPAPLGARSGVRAGSGPCEPMVGKTDAATPAVPSTPLPELTGTYSGDDGGIYYMQQSGSTLWWAGLSVNPKVPLEEQWHRGLDFTNVFSGSIHCNGQIVGNWADVPKGGALASGTLTLAVGVSAGETEITQISSTGGFTAKLWRRGNKGIDDLAVSRTSSMDLSARFDAVNKNSNETLHDNLKPYRDATVLFGHVIANRPNFDGGPDSQAPHVNYGPDYFPVMANFHNFGVVGRDIQAFCQASDVADGDFDFRVKVDLPRMERDFFTTGWGDRSNGPTVFRLKFTQVMQDPSFAPTEAYLGAEAIMYGRSGRCDRGDWGPALLPSWADHESNSMLINGRPVNGAGRRPHPDPGCDFIQPCPVVDFRYPFNNGIQLGKLLINAQGEGTYMRLTGPLVLDCGHSTVIPPERDPCYDEVDDASRVGHHQNQEMHPIYSIDIINYPFRPQDANVAARENLTGAWSGSDGSTYYIRQIGNTVWWLGLMRERQPMQRGTVFPIIGTRQLAPAFAAGDPPCTSAPAQCWAFATVFAGTITGTASGDEMIQGAWAGVPQSLSAGSSGGRAGFFVNPVHKVITPQVVGTIFPTLTKMYEPEDTTPPESTIQVIAGRVSEQGSRGAAGGVGVPSAREVILSATDQGGSGVQNLWYRYYLQTAQKPAFTFVAGDTVTFTLNSARGASYAVDFYATDNAGNDESPKHAIVSFTEKLP